MVGRKVAELFKRKDVEISVQRYLIDAMGAMAQGLFASLLMGTILATLGTQLGIGVLEEIGGYAKAAAGPAMAVSIGFALRAPALVLFSLVAVGAAANTLGGAGGPLAVLVIAIVACEAGKLVAGETKIDILVTPFVTIVVGCGLSPRCSLTLSGLSPRPVLCVQRALTALDGTVIEPQDIPLSLHWSRLPPETLLLAAGAWLLAKGQVPEIS